MPVGVGLKIKELDNVPIPMGHRGVGVNDSVHYAPRQQAGPMDLGRTVDDAPIREELGTD